MSRFWFRRTYGIVSGVFLSVLAVEILIAQQPPQHFGGAYSSLDERRQQLVGDWVARFTKVTGAASGCEVVLRRLGDAVECDARARGAGPPDPVPLEYGQALGMTFRFRTQAGDAPVLRLLWRKEGDAWRVTSYDVELP